MPLTGVDGSTTTDGTEQQLFSLTATKHYAWQISTHNMLAGDSLRIRVSVTDASAGTLRIYRDITLSGAQSEPLTFVPWLPAYTYKVTIQRTAGTDRAYTWTRWEQ